VLECDVERRAIHAGLSTRNYFHLASVRLIAGRNNVCTLHH
jgi:hypothetical protein